MSWGIAVRTQRGKRHNYFFIFIFLLQQKAISPSNEITMIFFPEFVYIVDYVYGILFIETSLHLWDEACLDRGE